MIHVTFMGGPWDGDEYDFAGPWPEYHVVTQAYDGRRPERSKFVYQLWTNGEVWEYRLKGLTLPKAACYSILLSRYHAP